MKKENKKDVSNKDLGNMIESLAVSTANGFEEMKGWFKDVNRRLDILENKVGGVEMGIFSLSQKISGIDRRMDDLSLNKIKYEDFDLLKKEVGVISGI